MKKENSRQMLVEFLSSQALKKYGCNFDSVLGATNKPSFIFSKTLVK